MKRCYGCFNTIDDSAATCPYCGYDTGAETPKWILPPGTILNGKYEVGRSLGEGGFGITYLAWDTYMQTKIAIKEYFPANVVTRDTTMPGGNTVSKNVTVGSINFDDGLKRYVQEASILSKFFDLPGIVAVKDFFYENETAYFVMEYIEGMSLKDYLDSQGGSIGYEEALALVQPVISSLHVIHQNNLLHRDISPDNIMISNDGTIKLIDFGAARSMEQAADNGMTVMLKHGYAPIEQYSRKGPQGPYTDVYGVCAVLYRMITGRVPLDATDRATSEAGSGDGLIPIRKSARKVPKHIAAAIERGLSVLPENRQQNMQQLYDELYISRRGVVERKVDDAYSMLVKALIAVAAVMVLVAALGIAYRLNYDRFENIREAFAVLSGGDDSSFADNRDSDEEDEEEEKEERKSRKSNDSDEDDTEVDYSQAEAATDVAVGDEVETEIDSTGAIPAAEEEPQTYVYGETTDDEMITAIEAVQNGTLQSNGLQVGTMLQNYSDTRGKWEGYRDDDGTVYVKYTGKKDGIDFSVIFKITENRSSSNRVDISFVAVGAIRDGQTVSDFNGFFKEIMNN
jgi:serine/threonine protein kinase